jgi:hypothetical protein
MKDEFKERLGDIRRVHGKAERKRTRQAPASLDEIGSVVKTEGVLIVERSLGDLTSGTALKSLLRKLKRTAKSARARDDIAPEVRSLLTEPAGALFVDTETTGLSGNMVFLLGVMRITSDDVRLGQVFARDYSEEPALLSEWVGILKGAGMLVSFNGKAFDLPVLRDRLGLHGIDASPEPPHLDLLHHARRRWRGVLPDCRLQTLEWQICGRRRAGDIPGEEIPAVYHHFVRTGQTADILSVFHHNALDLVTLADIALALAAPEDEPA